MALGQVSQEHFTQDVLFLLGINEKRFSLSLSIYFMSIDVRVLDLLELSYRQL